ncbi:MAG: hypothetical protein WCV55_03180 [Candidatus Paceibacterota bacterium]
MKIALFLAPFLKRLLPLSLRRWLDNSNDQIPKSITAKYGPLATDSAEEVVADTSTSTIAFCPLCAEAIKVDKSGKVGVFLYFNDATPRNPDVNIQPVHVLSVTCFGHSYQIGCDNAHCLKNNLNDNNRFGVLNSFGELVCSSGPLVTDLKPSAL